MKEQYDFIFIPTGAAALGGAERSIAWLAQGTQVRGKRVLLMAERALQSTHYPTFVKELGLEVRWVDWASEKPWWQNLGALWRTFSNVDAKVIQFNISWRHGMWLVPVVARLCTKAALVGSMRGMPDPHANIPRKLHFGFLPGLKLWHLPELACGWIWAKLLGRTVSVNALDFPPRLIDHYGFTQQRMRVIHNGVVYRDELPGSEARHALRERCGAGDGEILLAFVGRVSEEKGVDLILRAMAGLPARYRLVIAGDGPATDHLQALATQMGIADRVRFLGFVTDPYDIMAAADAVPVPSTWHEACSRVVVESLAQGTPVIGSRIGGTPELVADGAEGLLVEVGNVDALRDAFLRIGEAPAFRDRLARAARERAARDFRMESVVAKYHGVYRELVPGVV